MLKIVEIELSDENRVFPVESISQWEKDARLLLDVFPICVLGITHRDPKPEDDLEEMLKHQYGCFIEFADEHHTFVSDSQLDAGVDLYCKTLEAIT